MPGTPQGIIGEEKSGRHAVFPDHVHVHFQSEAGAGRQRTSDSEERRAAELAREAQRRAGTSPTLPAPALAGRYRHPAYGDMEIVAADDGGLSATFHGMMGPLEHFQDDVFLFKVQGWGLREEFVVRFLYASDGSVSSLLSTLQDGLPPEVFLRLGGGAEAPSPS